MINHKWRCYWCFYVALVYHRLVSHPLLKYATNPINWVHLWWETFPLLYIIFFLGLAYCSACALKITQCWQRYKWPVIHWLFGGAPLHRCSLLLGWRHWGTFTGLTVANSYKHNIECVVAFSHCQHNYRGKMVNNGSLSKHKSSTAQSLSEIKMYPSSQQCLTELLSRCGGFAEN